MKQLLFLALVLALLGAGCRQDEEDAREKYAGDYQVTWTVFGVDGNGPYDAAGEAGLKVKFGEGPAEILLEDFGIDCAAILDGDQFVIEEFLYDSAGEVFRISGEGSFPSPREIELELTSEGVGFFDVSTITVEGEKR